MATVSIVFPHQLFERHPALAKGRTVYLVEESLFYTQYKFHKQKLTFHRASMKAYESHLKLKGYTVTYIEANNNLHDIRNLIRHLHEQGITEIHFADVVDNWLKKRIHQMATLCSINCQEYDSPTFLTSRATVNEYFGKKKKFFQTDFYIQQRKQLNLLLDKKGNPLGGQWTYDADNRLNYPKGKKPPAVHFPKTNEHWKEASGYVEKNFPENYGTVNNDFAYPTTYHESNKWLAEFLKTRLQEFGPYEDAVVADENILHHSVLTPMLNVGLLTPQQVVDETVAFAAKHNVPLNSLEGFIRQVIGWREFIRGVYEVKGTEERTKNYWKFKRKIPLTFWTGNTGIPPIDSTIKKILQTGYCHHIERLMVLGNFMLLCEFDPDDVYRWFMEMFIDAYDWVMVPNVYGMSQFADGGLMATKPYISGSNYLMKMSDYPKGDWQKIWDALFWRFMHTHREFFLKNPRLGMLVKTFDKMEESKKNGHLKLAGDFLKRL
jgi:deoxyribodipyrimidine photolyase-related protein